MSGIPVLLFWIRFSDNRGSCGVVISVDPLDEWDSCVICYYPDEWDSCGVINWLPIGLIYGIPVGFFSGSLIYIDPGWLGSLC